jgi:hypothetical protein
MTIARYYVHGPGEENEHGTYVPYADHLEAMRLKDAQHCREMEALRERCAKLEDVLMKIQLMANDYVGNICREPVAAPQKESHE